MFRHVSFPMLVLGWVAFIAICALAILLGNVAMAQSAYVPSGSQAPSRSRSLFDDEMAPGVIGAIRQRLAAHGNPPVYLSLDIDCLDPAFAPGTGTPEPGGMSSNQVFSILEELADLKFVGMDCVEVAPAYDHAELTSAVAAQFVWTYLCGQVKRQAAHPRG